GPSWPRAGRPRSSPMPRCGARTWGPPGCRLSEERDRETAERGPREGWLPSPRSVGRGRGWGASRIMLDCQDLHTDYGTAHILQGVALEVGDGEVVALLGRNGAGKTTTLKTIVGLAPPRRGRVVYKGRDVAGWPPYRVSRAGVALVPETRGIFSYLTAREKLAI